MRKTGSPEELSAEELRRLLVEKRRASRQERLERYRRTGRVVLVAPDVDGSSLEDMRSGEFDESENEPPPPVTSNRRKKILDGLLLFVEVLAVVGLILLLFNGINMMRDLNNEVATALVQPTLTPTPLIVSVVFSGCP